MARVEKGARRKLVIVDANARSTDYTAFAALRVFHHRKSVCGPAGFAVQCSAAQVGQ